jgi:hypothetical protein
MFTSFIKIVKYRFSVNLMSGKSRELTHIIINWFTEAEQTFFFPTGLGREYAISTVQGKQLNMFYVLSFLSTKWKWETSTNTLPVQRMLSITNLVINPHPERLMSSDVEEEKNRLSLFQVPMCLLKYWYWWREDQIRPRPL